MQTGSLSIFTVTLLLTSAAWAAPAESPPTIEQPPHEKYSWGAPERTVLLGRAKPFHAGPGGIVYKEKLGDVGGLISFRFAADQLTEVRYRFGAKQQTAAASLADFNSVEQLLCQQHGEPQTRQVEWLDPKEQTEDVSGAIADGKLSQTTHWRSGRTAIIHSIYGDDGKVTHSLVYQPLELYQELFPEPAAQSTVTETATSAEPQ